MSDEIVTLSKRDFRLPFYGPYTYRQLAEMILTPSAFKKLEKKVLAESKKKLAAKKKRK